ncbi:MAG: hypothetical protein L6V93_03300 [Clostridiales bacterium]|nr:MAG: hypothetical protein L6V93_03300 [Clostridiales bacterium]
MTTAALRSILCVRRICLQNRRIFDIKFGYVNDKIPDSQLYIFSSISSNKPITFAALKCVLDKVRSGATLFISADTGLIRDIPEITGVDIAYREAVNQEITVIFKDKQLPVKTEFLYKIEKFARGGACNGRKTAKEYFSKTNWAAERYIFLTLPLEKNISAKNKVRF